jgi:HAD superfamily phosphoserine phosphatase-like hydrolase
MEILRSMAPRIAEALAKEPASGRPVAAFDADGTLWDKDVGEAFLRWLAAGGLLRDVTRDPVALWNEYEHRVERDRAAGYSWAVQIMAGHMLSDIETWSRQMAYAWPNYRPAMKALVADLETAGIEPWIVSASSLWVVRACAGQAGFAPERCLGIHVEVEDGILTDRVVRPVTCGPGKVEAIDRAIGVRPLLAVGDSMGDLEMLESARFPLVVGERASPNAKLFAVAAERGWSTWIV